MNYPGQDISNNDFSKQYQNKIFFYFVLVFATLLIVLKLPMARIYYESVSALITFAPMIVILVMAVFSYVKGRRYPEYEVVIRKFYLVFTLKFLVAILFFYVFYSPGIFYNPLLAFFRYFRTVATLEGLYFFSSYLLTIVIALAMIFVFFRAFQKSQGTYQGSISRLIRKTLYFLFFFSFFVFVSSASAYPSAYKPLTDTLGDAVYTLSSGSLKMFKGDDPAAYAKIESIRDFASKFSKSISQTSQNISDSKQEFKTDLELANKDLKISLVQSSKELSDKIQGDLAGKFSSSGGTVSGSLILSGDDADLNVEGTTTTRDIIPESNLEYNLGDADNSWNTLYIHRLLGASPVFIGSNSSNQSLTNDGDLVVSNNLEVQGILYADSLDINSAYTFPVADGTAGQVLQTDGLGTLSWEAGTAVGGLDGQIQFNNGGVLGGSAELSWNDVENSLNIAGNVGIGTTTDSAYVLKTDGVASGSGDVYFGGSGGGYLKLNEFSVAPGRWYLQTYDDTDAKTAEINFRPGSLDLYAYTQGRSGESALEINTDDLNFYVTPATNTAGTLESFRYTADYSDLNTAGDGYTAIKLNVTDAQAGATGARNLMDLQLDVASRFRVGAGPTDAVTDATELVTNGTFVDASSWTFGGGWSFDTDHAENNGTGGDMTQALAIIAGDSYSVVYTVSGMTTGGITASLGAAGAPTSHGANGTYNDVITTSDTSDLTFTGDVGFDGQVDNVSVVKITPASAAVVINDELQIRSIGGGTLAMGTVNPGQFLDGGNNILIGRGTGSEEFTSGSGNIFIGDWAAQFIQSGNDNLFMGKDTGAGLIYGNNNVILGSEAASQGYSLSGFFSDNTFVGAYSGYVNTTGSQNVFMGTDSGYSNTTGSGNIFLGYQAGYSETGSNKLYIENSNSAAPLIYGDFSIGGELVTINGQLNATDGLVTKTKTGACSDTDFNLDTNGLVCIDDTEDSEKIYFRANDEWYYVSKTGGFQIPDYEAFAYQFPQKQFDLTQPLQEGDILLPFVDRYLSDGNIHGLYARFQDLKPELFEEENQKISALSVKTDQNISTLLELQASIDEQLGIVESGIENLAHRQAGQESKIENIEDNLADQKSQISNQNSLIATLQTQIAELQNKLNTETNIAQIDLNTQDLAFIKLLLGTDRVNNPEDVDILGKLSAKTLATGGIEITMIDLEAPTIGEGTILADKNIKFIETNAVVQNSKIYITPIGSTDNQVVYVGEIDAEGLEKNNYKKGFEVKVDRLDKINDVIIVPKEMVFNWWIVQADNQ